MRRLIVPIDMGGSPVHCAVWPKAGPAPGPDLVQAMIEHYEAERMPAGGARVEVAFFRGKIPSPQLIHAAGERDIRVACSPADLNPEVATRLRAAGVRTVELEVLTFDSV